MDMNKINAYSSNAVVQASVAPAKNTEKKEAEQPVIKSAEEINGGVIYEPSEEGKKLAQTVSESKTDRTAIVKQLKSDLEAQKQSMVDMVREALGQQVANTSIANGDDVWKFLASGDYTVTEAAKKKAEEAISEDGYWGVKQTSDRIVEFAKALAGDDVSKADKLLKAFDKGYKEATKTWGKELPDISKKTYDEVHKKFDEWKAKASNPELD